MIVGLALSALLMGAPATQAPAARLVQLDLAPVPILVQAEPAQATPATPARRRPVRRRAARRDLAPPVVEAPTLPPRPATPQAEIAPMPNRSIVGPRAPIERQVTRLRPDLIEPRSLPDSRRQDGGNSSYTEKQDRLFRDPAAGARLEIPFSY
ncbi:hypothetical protein D9599_18935 [Roseomonas sp. KE2513]|uniref:hypothetical protein n=1 Tax=Roseomonas sp. KE2513 TaxID=2479202 RepID=UPI0018DFC412|nr:hypothetical protein [Roseomonas sp. KE2513]MBI0537638.1 hypothetical protein [Roseomonas sp. KE2513]